MTKPKRKAILERSRLDSGQLTVFPGCSKLCTVLADLWRSSGRTFPELCPVCSLLLPAAIASPLGLHFCKLDKPSSCRLSVTRCSPLTLVPCAALPPAYQWLHVSWGVLNWMQHFWCNCRSVKKKKISPELLRILIDQCSPCCPSRPLGSFLQEKLVFSLHCCTDLFSPHRILHLSLLNFMRFLTAHFSALLTALWMALPVSILQLVKGDQDSLQASGFYIFLLSLTLWGTSRRLLYSYHYHACILGDSKWASCS